VAPDVRIIVHLPVEGDDSAARLAAHGPPTRPDVVEGDG
jgi:hypothetical protein